MVNRFVTDLPPQVRGVCIVFNYCHVHGPVQHERTLWTFLCFPVCDGWNR